MGISCKGLVLTPKSVVVSIVCSQRLHLHFMHLHFIRSKFCTKLILNALVDHYVSLLKDAKPSQDGRTSSEARQQTFAQNWKFWRAAAREVIKGD